MEWWAALTLPYCVLESTTQHSLLCVSPRSRRAARSCRRDAQSACRTGTAQPAAFLGLWSGPHGPCRPQEGAVRRRCIYDDHIPRNPPNNLNTTETQVMMRSGVRVSVGVGRLRLLVVGLRAVLGRSREAPRPLDQASGSTGPSPRYPAMTWACVRARTSTVGPISEHVRGPVHRGLAAGDPARRLQVALHALHELVGHLFGGQLAAGSAEALRVEAAPAVLRPAVLARPVAPGEVRRAGAVREHRVVEVGGPEPVVGGQVDPRVLPRGNPLLLASKYQALFTILLAKEGSRLSLR
jgi:hypothetical protein